MTPDRDGRTDGRRLMGRRSFLAATAVSGAAALAGCSGIQIDSDGITWGDDESEATPEAATPTPVTDQSTREEYELVTAELAPQEYVVAPVAKTPARFRLHNFRLFVSVANDSVTNGRNTEEIYGDVYIRGYDGRDGSRILADGYTAGSGLVHTVNAGDAIQLREHQRAEQLPIDVTVTFPDSATIDAAASYIEVGADLFEHDPRGPNDILGLASTGSVRRWSLAEAPSDPTRTDRNHEATFDMGFSDRVTVVRLSFDVSKLD